MSKPYLDIRQQLAHIKSRGIYLGSKTAAKRNLTRVNFQRLLAYRLHFLDSNKQIKPGTKFKHICRLHEFDKELRNLTRPILESIELNLRRNIADTLGAKGIHSYLNNQNFKCHFRHAEFLNIVNRHQNDAERAIKTSGKNKQLPSKVRKIVTHHLKNHKNDLPIYKTVEILSFGELSRFFQNLEADPNGTIPKDKDKIRMIYQYRSKKNISNSILESWLRDLVEVRNRCAHYDMLWDYKKQLKFLKGDKAWLAGNLTPGKPEATYKFYGICLIFNALCLSKKEFIGYMRNLEKLAQKYSNIISLSDLGFPSTWKQDLGI